MFVVCYSLEYRVKSTINTYAWRPATAISKIMRESWINITGVNLISEVIPDPTSLSSKCPAIILATSRIERVNGRINRLTSSISTIRGISPKGVPTGTK